MTISANQINFFLSGDSNNSNPSLSLGGSISNFNITNSINNLFSNITSEEAVAGKTDYRCFYIKNISETDSIYDVELYVSSQGSSGSSVSIGTEFSNEIQNIEILGSVSSGDAEFSYNQNNFTVNWSTFSSDLISGLESLGIQGVQVSYSNTNNIHNFSIVFAGDSANKNHPTLILINNNFSNSPIITISKQNTGRSINYSPSKLVTDYVAPVNVQFIDDPTRLSIGNLKPNDFIPVWVRRTTSAGSDFQSDFFKFKISGKPFA